MWETYRMLGEEREAELLREAQRLRAGASVRSRPSRHTRKMAWMPGWIRRLVTVFRHDLARPAAHTDALPLQIDELSVAAAEVATENEDFTAHRIASDSVGR
jgi:hypothetical protein